MGEKRERGFRLPGVAHTEDRRYPDSEPRFCRMAGGRVNYLGSGVPYLEITRE